jgi:hypothetical protein
VQPHADYKQAKDAEASGVFIERLRISKHIRKRRNGK